MMLAQKKELKGLELEQYVEVYSIEAREKLMTLSWCR